MLPSSLLLAHGNLYMYRPNAELETVHGEKTSMAILNKNLGRPGADDSHKFVVSTHGEVIHPCTGRKPYAETFLHCNLQALQSHVQIRVPRTFPSHRADVR